MVNREPLQLLPQRPRGFAKAQTSFTAKSTKIAKEQKSITAEDAKDAEEKNSLTAKETPSPQRVIYTEQVGHIVSAPLTMAYAKLCATSAALGFVRKLYLCVLRGLGGEAVVFLGVRSALRGKAVKFPWRAWR